MEANKRIEDLVAQRVEQELERRREEIEAEVLRRVEEAKKIMEAQMLEEMERKRQEQMEEQKKREVGQDAAIHQSAQYFVCHAASKASRKMLGTVRTLRTTYVCVAIDRSLGRAISLDYYHPTEDTRALRETLEPS